MTYRQLDDDAGLVVLATEVLSNFCALDWSDVLSADDVTTQSWLPVIHHDVPTTFLAKVEQAYSQHTAEVKCSKLSRFQISLSAFHADPEQVASLSAALSEAANILNSPTYNSIFHADIALTKLFQGLAVIFVDTDGSSSGWLACAGTSSRSSLHANQRLLAPDQRELNKSFPKTCSNNLRAPLFCSSCDAVRC